VIEECLHSLALHSTGPLISSGKRKEVSRALIISRGEIRFAKATSEEHRTFGKGLKELYANWPGRYNKQVAVEALQLLDDSNDTFTRDLVINTINELNRSRSKTKGKRTDHRDVGI